jgi:translation initiation factor IF-2
VAVAYVSPDDQETIDEVEAPADGESEFDADAEAVAAGAGTQAAGSAPVAEAGPKAQPAESSAPGAAAEPAKTAPARRGAKILGRIELNKADVAKSEATHAELERTLGPTPSTVPGRRRVETAEESAAAAAKRRQKAHNQNVKWQADVEDFAPVSEAQVAKPKFWERGPTRRQQRSRPRRTAAAAAAAARTQPAQKVTVRLPTSVKELSALLGIRAAEIISRLLTVRSVAVGVHQALDDEMVLTIATEFEREIEILAEQTAETAFQESRSEAQEKSDSAAAGKSGVPRPPVVTVMGHVDHGKTSLLDSIRKTRVVDSEHGGITQHIRAYQVATAKGGRVTFLDTPGHRAFTEMRRRGADVTDVVVLVVAADDGVMPQTIESLQHARAANPDMPIVVALNKVDKRDANPLRVKQQLMAQDLLPEEFGGKVGVIECSATTGKGIDELIERVALEAEIHDLRSEPSLRGEGVVIEATKEEGKGVVATVLVRQGTLRVRDPFLCGSTWGRVRLMEDDAGTRIQEAPPSSPVRVYGFKGEVPEAGEKFVAVEDEKQAEKVASERDHAVRTGQTVERPKVTLENLFATLGTKEIEEIPVIVKADVQGSIEVLKSEFEELKHAEVKIRLLRAAVGGITEEDVMLAGTSNALIFGFHVTADAKARKLQEQLGVEIRTYFVIYELIDDLKKAMAGLLKPEESERIVGHVAVRETFKVSRLGTIAGCFVTDGLIRRNDKVRVLRDGKVVYSTGLDSLRRFKDDVREVKEGFECGIKLAKFDDVKVGDTIEAYEIVQTERELMLG